MSEVAMTSYTMNVHHLMMLKDAHARRLHLLDGQAATFGTQRPPAIATEISEIHVKISNIDEQIRRAEHATDDPIHRRPIAPNELEERVTDYLQYQVTHRLEFTAHDGTFALRRRLPDIDITHNDVRYIVQLQMRLVVALGMYTLETVKYDTATARRYVPVRRPA
jgi:hypothetical protein